MFLFVCSNRKRKRAKIKTCVTRKLPKKSWCSACKCKRPANTCVFRINASTASAASAELVQVVKVFTSGASGASEASGASSKLVQVVQVQS